MFFLWCYILTPLSIPTLIILKHSSHYSMIFISSKNNFFFDTPDVYFLDSFLVLHFFMHLEPWITDLSKGNRLLLHIVFSFFPPLCFFLPEKLWVYFHKCSGAIGWEAVLIIKVQAFSIVGIWRIYRTGSEPQAALFWRYVLSLGLHCLAAPY